MEPSPTPILAPVFEGEGPFRAALWRQDALDAVLAASSPGDWFAEEEAAELAAAGRSPKRRREWLASRLALKTLLVGSGVARRAREAVVRKDAGGRPFVAARGAEIPCSISHSAPYVLCAFALGDGVAVGVDVERRTSRLSRLRGEFVSPGDALLPRNDPAGDDTLLWSLKESLSKLLGTGLGCGFANLSCRETAPGHCLLRDAEGAESEGRYAWLGPWVAAIAWRPPSGRSGP